MTLLFQIAASIVSASLRATLLLAVALLAAGALRRRPASARHFLLATAVLLTAMLPLFDAWPSRPQRFVVSAGSAATMMVTHADTAATAVALVWAAGVAFGLLRIVCGAVAIRTYRRRSSPVTDPAMLALLRDVSRAARLRRPPELRIGGDTVPMTWGIIRAVILVPASFAGWDESLRRSVLLHETAHIARADALTRLVAEIARVLYWFHPLVRFAARRLRVESERACDDAAVRLGVPHHDYAAQLLAVARTAAQPAPWLRSQSAAETGMLAERVIALAAVRERACVRPLMKAAIVVAALLVALASANLQVAAPWTAYARAYAIPPALARLIMATAADERVDVDLAFALVKTESGFRPDVVSPHGAIGLTQILPSTARRVESSITTRELFDRRTNLALGFRLLRSHLHRYGDTRLALTAYAIGRRELDRRRAAATPLPTSYSRAVLAARAPI